MHTAGMAALRSALVGTPDELHVRLHDILRRSEMTAATLHAVGVRSSTYA